MIYLGSPGEVSMSNTNKPRKRPVAQADEESDGGVAMAGENRDGEDETDSGDESDLRSTEHTAEVETSGNEDPQHTFREIKKPSTTLRRGKGKGKGKGKAITTSASRKKVAKPPTTGTRRSKRVASGRTTATKVGRNKTESLERGAGEPGVEIAEPRKESSPTHDDPGSVTDDDEL